MHRPWCVIARFGVATRHLLENPTPVVGDTGREVGLIPEHDVTAPLGAVHPARRAHPQHMAAGRVTTARDGPLTRSRGTTFGPQMPTWTGGRGDPDVPAPGLPPLGHVDAAGAHASRERPGRTRR